MLLKFCSLNLLLVLVYAVLMSPASATHFFPRCDEEMWEEVPCEQIVSPSSTTTTTTAKPIQPTYAPTTQKPYTTTRPPVKKTTTIRTPTIHTTSPAPLTSTTTSTVYNNCYCECKVGCKEFCRKVTGKDASQKQITQITKTTHRVPNGQLNSEHVHQHRFVPDPHVPYTPYVPPTKPTIPHPVYPIEPPKKVVNPYVHTNLAYKIQPRLPPLPAPPTQLPPVHIVYPQKTQNIYEEDKDTNIYPDALLESSYSVDELTRLLQMESLNKDAGNSYTQPAIYGPSYTVHGNIQPSAPIYHPPPTTYGHSTPATPAEYPKHENNSSASPYTSAVLSSSSHRDPSSLGPSANPPYANYVNKIGLSEPQLYGAASPPSQANSDQQSSASLSYHTAHSNPSAEYLNSIPYGSYYAPPAAGGYAPQSEPYAAPY
ncbi:mucin-2 [Zeugodacus cucurbitae]|uniref:mucin-2 n=1 Tax=Zeugodacus cucurbitae TaxID=28588 RepID=UPI0023D919E4|nr:mucin-2 [Zeugodacus cucurbitae]